MLVVTASGLAIPALAQYGIDHGISAGDRAVLVLAVVLFLVAGLVGWLAGYYQSYLSSWVGERVLLDLRTETFRHIMRLELGYHERTPTGRTVSRLTSDIEALDQLVTDGVTSLVVNGLTFIGVVGDPVRLRRAARPADVRDLPRPGDRDGPVPHLLHARLPAHPRARGRGAGHPAGDALGHPRRAGLRPPGADRARLPARSTTSTARPTWPRSACRASTSPASSCWPGSARRSSSTSARPGCSTRTCRSA